MQKVINGLIIDPIIFSHPFVPKCDACICSGECCWYGVYTDLKEMEMILDKRDLVKKYMDDSQTLDETKWFERIEEDKDFESGYCAGTEIYNNKCVFLDKNGFCSLQKAAMDLGEDKWNYKPLYCILFPLVIFEGKLTIDDEHIERMHYCNKAKNQTSTIFEAMKDEIRHFLGEEGYKELLDYKNEYFNNVKMEVLDYEIKK